VFLLLLFFLFVNTNHLIAQNYRLAETKLSANPVESWFFAPSTDVIGKRTRSEIVLQNNTTQKRLKLAKDFLRAVLSKNGKYVAMIRLTGEDKQQHIQHLIVEVYTTNADVSYQIQMQQFYDDTLPTIVLSDEGGIIAGQAASGTVWFYNATGDLMKKVRLFSTPSYDLERVLQLDLSAGTQRLAVIATQRNASHLRGRADYISANPFAFLFDLSGDEEWRRPLPESSAGRISVSPERQYIVASSYSVDMRGYVKKNARLFDGNGDEITDFDYLFRTAVFSQDSQVLLLAEKNNVMAVRTKDAHKSWQKRISRKKGMIAAVSLTGDGQTAAILAAKNKFQNNEFIFFKPEIQIINKSGNLIQTIDLNGETFVSPELKFSATGKELRVGFRESYQIYEAVK